MDVTKLPSPKAIPNASAERRQRSASSITPAQNANPFGNVATELERVLQRMEPLYDGSKPEGFSSVDQIWEAFVLLGKWSGSSLASMARYADISLGKLVVNELQRADESMFRATLHPMVVSDYGLENEGRSENFRRALEDIYFSGRERTDTGAEDINSWAVTGLKGYVSRLSAMTNVAERFKIKRDPTFGLSRVDVSPFIAKAGLSTPTRESRRASLPDTLA